MTTSFQLCDRFKRRMYLSEPGSMAGNSQETLWIFRNTKTFVRVRFDNHLTATVEWDFRQARRRPPPQAKGNCSFTINGSRELNQLVAFVRPMYTLARFERIDEHEANAESVTQQLMNKLTGRDRT